MIRLFIEPCDIVFFRDDLPFGTAGNQVARCHFPPRPSVIAGALRTKALAARNVDFDIFRAGHDVPEVVRREIGAGDGEDNPVTPGSFRLVGMHLGCATTNTEYYLVGRDLVSVDNGQRGVLAPRRANGMPGISSLRNLAPLAVALRQKPAEGWLSPEGYVRYLLGAVVEERPITEKDILAVDYRVGIGLDASCGVVDEGRLFSSQGVVLKERWGFIAGVEGCSLLPEKGLLRLGGDGRMARLSPWPGREPDWSPVQDLVTRSGRFRWILQTPAIFRGGWLPGAIVDARGDLVYRADGFAARLVSASVRGPELAGGWDLVQGRPKAFRRTVPAGSVYWFEMVEGDPAAAWAAFHGRSVSDERGNEGFGLVHLGGWSYV